ASRFFSHSTARTGVYALSLHDALPISVSQPEVCQSRPSEEGEYVASVYRPSLYRPSLYRPSLYRPSLYRPRVCNDEGECIPEVRSEEHTSELQSRENLVCRLLLEKNKK